MRIAIVGAGTMGRAILGGLLEGRAAGDAAPQVTVVTRRPEHADEIAQRFGVPAGADLRAGVRGADTVLLCVKPKNVLGLAAQLAGALDPGACVASIAAGVRLADLAAVLPAGQPLVRVMPNTPCLVGAGMTAVSAGPTARPEQVAAVRDVFATLGRATVLDEEYMDAVTGLSGSGPAFVYVIIEALSEGGVMTGLPRDAATELAAQTVMGAARMVLDTTRHPAALKDAVTTPAGCTISALLKLEDGKLRSVLARAVEEAARSAAALRPPAPGDEAP